MKFDALLRTRDFDTDYRWIFYPSYLEKDMEKRLSFLMRMMQDSQLKQYFTGENLQNIFYIHDVNGSILVRCGFSEGVDWQGRPIQSLEGLACPPEKNRLFWYALPYLIDRLAAMPLLRDRWMRGETSSQAYQEWALEFSALTEDCLFMETGERGSIWQMIHNWTPAMERLVRDIKDATQMFDFVYGTREKGFYPTALDRYYTPRELPTLQGLEWQVLDTDPQPMLNEGDSAYRVQIDLESGSARRYALTLVARDGRGEAIGQTEPLTFGKTGINIDRIEKARIALDEKLERAGYFREKGRR